MTTAATTAFCAHKLEGGDGRYLWIDGNGKVTAGNGTLANPSPNAFSLVQIADCPFATSICAKSCYVHNLEKHAPDTHALYQHNSSTIRNILNNVPIAIDDSPTQWLTGDSPTQWARRLGTWIAKNCQGGFRWHVSGDVFSLRYAQWIAQVCQASPNVQHWIYTRSFSYVGPLMAAENLTINLSCDAENYQQAMTLYNNCRELQSEPFGGTVSNVRLCYLQSDPGFAPNLPPDSVIFPDYHLRGETDQGRAWFHKRLTPAQKKMVCPVDYHGKSERRRCGPCDKCIKTPA
jgi:hypothetical protein